MPRCAKTRDNGGVCLTPGFRADDSYKTALNTLRAKAATYTYTHVYMRVHVCVRVFVCVYVCVCVCVWPAAMFRACTVHQTMSYPESHLNHPAHTMSMRLQPLIYRRM